MIAALNPASTINRKGHLTQQVTLRIEPGHEEMWFALREFRGEFTAEDLATAVDGRPSRASRYLLDLTKSETVRIVGQTTDQRTLYRVKPLGGTPVVLDESGEWDDDYILRRELWTATRRLKHGVMESSLIDMVGQHIAINAKTVRRWISRLLAADYLCEMGIHPKTKEKQYQLRSMRDTGPLPPRFCESMLLYDVNLALRGEKANAFFGVGHAREVKL